MSQVGPGARVGKYETLQRIATGGMAEIFLARVSGMLGFQKLVVLKRILPHLSSRTDFIEMFLDEARIAATLHHPNVVQTYEIGISDRTYFIAMEYLPGEDLRSILRAQKKTNARMPLEHAINIGVGLAAGLHYAHTKTDFDGAPLAIVHRDVTPQNVIVSYDGIVKLLDFGIAKASNRINETKSGSFKGKVPYMSPEQCSAQPLDRRTDLFSLGILLYELTLGRRPFRGDSDFQVLKQIVEGPVTPPRAIDPGYDPRLEQIVLRALEKDPAKRFQSAREMQEALDDLSREQRLRTSPMALQAYMHKLFPDKVGAWQAVQEQAKSPEEHFATVAAEREADLVAENLEPPEPPPDLLPSLPPDLAQGSALAPGSSAARAKPDRMKLVLGAAGLTVAVLSAALISPHVRLRSLDQAGPPSAMAASAPPGAAIEVPPPSEIPSLPASASIVTVPPGASLTLDGEPLAQHSPATLMGLRADHPYTLVVRAPGYAGISQRFTLGAGEEAVFEVSLKTNRRGSVRRADAPASAHHATPPAAAPAGRPAAVAAAPPVERKPELSGEGTLVVASNPWCDVIIDGKKRGTTPLNVKLPAGPHDVVLSNGEFKINRAMSLTIEANQTTRKKLDFAPE